MKVMISMPMNGRNEAEVKENKKKIKEAFAKLHIEVVNNIFLEEAQGYNYPALYYLAKSIDIMGKVDAVYFVKDWASARGCRIERKIAENYGVKILDYDFLPDYAEEEATVDGFRDGVYSPEEYKEILKKDGIPFEV